MGGKAARVLKFRKTRQVKTLIIDLNLTDDFAPWPLLGSWLFSSTKIKIQNFEI